MVRRLLWDNKVPETDKETGVATAPGPEPTGSAAGFWGENQVNGSLPCQTGRSEQHQEKPGCLKSQWGNKDKVPNTQGQCIPAETVHGWEELGHDGP